MNDLLQRLVTNIDLLESRSTTCFAWKESLNAILEKMESVVASVASEQANTNNPLFQHLAKQNEILMALVLLVLIAASKD